MGAAHSQPVHRAALYHAPETTADFQPVLVAAWEVSMAWVDTLVVTGLVGGYAAVAGLIEEGDIVALGVFALVFFHIGMGWKSWRLSLQS